MTTTAPRVDGRAIGLAHYASRAVLEHVLAPHGVTFLQFVTLRLASVTDGPAGETALIDGVAGTVKVDEAEVRRAIGDLHGAGLLTSEEPSGVRLTEAGRELYATAAAETTAIADRLYAGIPEGDRSVAGRVLALVTERADAELAALRK
ncbi:MarR family transcriptional regulator [Streptomyces sp900105245]|uniref:MarR family transcriptional regulator n=1 Tax=Streptomyces sp. 900105245 TaxID=3154379 RepID=A0ABV1U6V3_9ACTN